MAPKMVGTNRVGPHEFEMDTSGGWIRPWKCRWCIAAKRHHPIKVWALQRPLTDAGGVEEGVAR